MLQFYHLHNRFGKQIDQKKTTQLRSEKNNHFNRTSKHNHYNKTRRREKHSIKKENNQHNRTAQKNIKTESSQQDNGKHNNYRTRESTIITRKQEKDKRILVKYQLQSAGNL